MSQLDWIKLQDESLLDLKISKLNLSIDNSNVGPYIEQLYKELDHKKLSFKPPCFLADEWFCPVNVPAIGIPFYLAQDRLRKLEQKLILEVEGGTKEWFMQLIRHEAGHAYAYAYRLNRRRTWQKIFGLSSKPYPDTYRPRPHSKSFVLHLDNWYAQSHPDEDFAETFAIWLTPNSNWKQKYKGWRALNKLNYVDRLMSECANKEPLNKPQDQLSQFSGLNIKLKTYYTRKKKLYEDSYPDFYDRDLKRIFSQYDQGEYTLKASKYLRSQKRKILQSTATWTKEKKYIINNLLQELTERCDELELFARTDDNNLDMQVSTYITAMIMNHLFTGKFRS